MQMVSFTSGSRTTLASFMFLSSLLIFFVERNKIILFNAPLMGVAFAFSAIYLYIFFVNHRKFFLTSFYQIYFMIGLLVSAASISSGAQMIEVGAYGSANGSFWIVFAFFVAGMETTCLGFHSRFLSFLGRMPPNQTWDSSQLIIISTISMVVIVSTYIFVTIGSPITLGIDRIAFWRNYIPTYFSILPSFVLQTYFFVCFYLLVSVKRSTQLAIPVLLFGFYIIITVIILGEKLSAFVILISAFLMVVSGTFPNFRVKLTHFIFAVTVALLILLLISATYIANGRDPSFIFARIALQAQLVWSVLADPYGFRLLPGPDWSCFFGCGWSGDGRDFMAYKYLPYGLYNFYSESGTALSGFMPALPILTFGLILAFAIHLLACFLIGLLQREISISIEKENFISSFLLYKVLFGVVLAWYGARITALAGSMAAFILFAFYLVLFGRAFRQPGRPLAKDT